LIEERDETGGKEAGRLPIPQLAAALVETPAAYAEVARRLLTRTDVAWCKLETEVPVAR
jgi:hypothetical protein